MYAKFINETTIEAAPSYKDGIFNYNLNIEQMSIDGYKEVIEINNPDSMKMPTIKYTEKDNKIEKEYIETYVEPTLEDLKRQKHDEINDMRDKTEQGGFEYLDKVFDSDPISCQRMSCAAQAMQAAAMVEDVPVITWTCKDNTTIDLNAQQLMGLVVALAEWSNSCHVKATTLKQQVENAQSKEELDKIVW